MTERERPYLLFSLCLSVLAIVVLAVNTLAPLDTKTHAILAYADDGICLLFFIDFLISLFRAENKWQYLLRWGWLDLLSSVPTVEALRLGRAGRIVRILRMLRWIRSTRILAKFILDRRAEGTFLAVALVSLLFIVVASVSILHLENTPDANIKTAEDALWWSVVTITTVGYGDRFPVTSEGRLLAVLLMFAGVGLFGTFSGFVAAWFLQPAGKARESDIAALRAEIIELRRALAIPLARSEAGISKSPDL